jgi:hypothetical protein
MVARIRARSFSIRARVFGVVLGCTVFLVAVCAMYASSHASDGPPYGLYAIVRWPIISEGRVQNMYCIDRCDPVDRFLSVTVVRDIEVGTCVVSGKWMFARKSNRVFAIDMETNYVTWPNRQESMVLMRSQGVCWFERMRVLHGYAVYWLGGVAAAVVAIIAGMLFGRMLAGRGEGRRGIGGHTIG